MKTITFHNKHLTKKRESIGNLYNQRNSLKDNLKGKILMIGLENFINNRLNKIIKCISKKPKKINENMI